MADKDWDLVPERDEAAIKSRKGKVPENNRGGGDKKSRPEGTGDSMALWSFIFLLVFASLGVNVYLYLNLTDMQAENEALETRVVDLESKLDVTDESFSESASALRSTLQEHSSELETHMSEIRKLWAVAYDRNRPAIEELNTKVSKINQRIESLSQVGERVTAVENRLESLSSQTLMLSTDVDEATSMAREVRDSLNNQTSRLDSLQATQRDQSEAIDAIDDFRKQMNQRVLRLENSAPSASGGSDSGSP